MNETTCLRNIVSALIAAIALIWTNSAVAQVAAPVAPQWKVVFASGYIPGGGVSDVSDNVENGAPGVRYSTPLEACSTDAPRAIAFFSNEEKLRYTHISSFKRVVYFSRPLTGGQVDGTLEFDGYECRGQGLDSYSQFHCGSECWVEGATAVPVCAAGQTGGMVDGQYLCSVAVAADSQDCECEEGDSPVGGAPRVEVGNPIAVDSGSKEVEQVDYQSADGLLTVERRYESRARNPLYSDSPLEIVSFSDHWHGLIPGRIDVVGDQAELLEYFASNGSIRRFFADGPASYDFGAGDQTRLKLSMVSVPTIDRIDYFAGAAGQGNLGEVRLSFANGDYVLFRRTGDYNSGSKRRVLVPVERGLANGYAQWFDYADGGIYPTGVRDTFGRQLALTWADLGWSHDIVRGARKGPTQASPPLGFTQIKGLSAIALPDGTTLQYTYGQTDVSGYLGRLDGVTRRDAGGVTLWARSYLYEDVHFPAALTGILDQSGSRLSTYAYDAQGRATLSERAGGADRQQVAYSVGEVNSFPTFGKPVDVRTVTNPLGLETVYTYSQFKPYPSEIEPEADATRTPRRLLSVEVKPGANVEGSVESLAYSAAAQISSSVDPNGNASSVGTNDQTLRPDSVTDALGVTRSIVWHPMFDLPTQILLPGKLAVNFTYDASGLLLSRSEVDQTAANFGATRTTTFSWAPGGLLLLVNGSRGPGQHGGQDDITTFTYDGQGNRLTMTNALGHVTHYAGYDANGNRGEMIDPNGVKTTFLYDPLGRISTITIKHPTDSLLDALTHFDYDIEGRIVGLTRPDTAKLMITYDLAGRLLAVSSDDGERIEFGYDAMGNVLSETVKRADGTQSRGTVRTFDGLGRLLSQTLGSSRTTSWTYDRNGNATQIVSPRGNSSTQAFDALDRLTSVAAPASGTATTSFDSQDNPVIFTDSKQVATQFVHNGFGDMVREISPDRGTTTYTYDDGGDLVSSTDGRGVTITYQRDILGRVTRKTPSDNPANAVFYYWDQPDTETTWRIGRLTRISDASGTTVFNYDHRGSLTMQRQRLLGTTSWVWLRYSYDLADRVARITYPSGRQVAYVRDGKGRVRTVRTRPDSTVTTWTTLASGIAYEPMGPVRAMTMGNGLRAVTDWGDEGLLAARRLYRVADGTNVSRLTYGYDADDNIMRITDTIDAGRTQRYGYDAAGRLIRFDAASGPVQRTSFTYDAGGNRLREQRRTLPSDPQPQESDVYTYGAGTNRLATVRTGTGATARTRAVAYDTRGNTVTETRPGGITVTTAYDGYARLTGYTRSDEAPLVFDYNGRDDRVAMTRGTGAVAETRRFVYAPDGRVMGEYGASAAEVKAEFIWLSPEAANDNDPTNDGIAGYAPLAVATPNLSGAIQLNWVHGNHLGVPLVFTDAAGQVTTNTTNDYLAPGFPGQSRTLGDLYYNHYRDYDPSTGRYIQADPIGLAGGANPFLYAGGNPVTGMDPWGLEYLDLLDGSTQERALARKMLAQYNRLSRAQQNSSLFIFSHGSKFRICPNRNDSTFCVNAAQLANILRANGKLKPGRSITLWACDTGRDPRGFAQTLANATGTTVYAPTSWTWWNDKGMTGIYPYSDRRFAGSSGQAWWDPGAMPPFKPAQQGGN